MTGQQIRWAMQHDWFVSSKEVDGIWFVVVKEVMLLASGEYAEQELEFKFYQELRAWAGY